MKGGEFIAQCQIKSKFFTVLKRDVVVDDIGGAV
jgi:hypothetical protein